MRTLNEEANEYAKDWSKHASIHSNPRLAQEDRVRRAFLAGASVGEKHGRRDGYLSALNAASTVTPDDRFNDLISREDYGDREQLKRFFRVGIQVGEARERERVLEIVGKWTDSTSCREGGTPCTHIRMCDEIERRITEATTEPGD